MQIVADLHLHSKYSRAVSQNMILPTIAEYAMQKGIDLLTVSDWTHPLWLKEISSQLDEVREGVYQLKPEIRSTKSLPSRQAGETNPNGQNPNNKTEPKFIFSTEISSIYTQGGKLRRIHSLVFVPSLEVAEKVNKTLVSRGANLNADGRPIIGMSAKDLLTLVLEIDEQCMLIPAHVWTPHFGVYGSASGFESLDEAFGDLAKHIYGIETGLSSDPEMNWQIKELDTRSILSFSDAHSPAKMAREATVFELPEITYEQLRRAIMAPMFRKGTKGEEITSGSFVSSETSRVIYTVEFYPEEGKYHFSGHRNCKVAFGPEEIKKQGSVCPVCGKRLTEGVLFRLQQLSDTSLEGNVEKKANAQGLEWYTHRTKKHPPYVKLVPLLEIIAESLDSTVFSQKTKTLFQEATDALGGELTILLKTPIEEIAKITNPKVAQGVEKVRKGDIAITPGFDGEYGKVAIWQEGEAEISKDLSPQLSIEF